MSSTKVVKSLKLFKREGSADKVYQGEILDDGGTFRVRFMNARRGQALRLAKEFPGLGPDAAQAQFDKGLQAKRKDGYTEDEGGQAYTSSEFAGRDSGLRPSLPRPVPEGMLPHLISSSAWALQEKANGENRLLQMDAQGNVRGANKKGLLVDIPAQWVEQVRQAATDPFILCGEHVDDKLYVFDALMIGGEDLRQLTFAQRYTVLESTLAAWRVASIEVLKAYFDPQHKAQMLETWQRENREGGVFKLKGKPHVEGLTDVCLKHKFVESSACQVLALNEKRSVRIGLLDADGAVVPVGNVTLPANAPAIAVGDVVEVQYLYFNPGGAFEQPVFLFKRGDMEPSECLLSQVTRLKPGDGTGQADNACSERRERMRA